MPPYNMNPWYTSSDNSADWNVKTKDTYGGGKDWSISHHEQLCQTVLKSEPPLLCKTYIIKADNF